MTLKFPYGKTSTNRLSTCHPKLIEIFHEVAMHVDVSIICGHRNEDDQHTAFITGASTKDWPDSRHNSLPSDAIDAALHPINWNDAGRQRWFAGLVMGIAAKMGPEYELRWGGDWDQDPNTKNKFQDLWHFELVNP